MPRIVIIALLFCIVQANAIFVSASLGDSRLQTDNNIYKPGGIVHVALEAGLFNEPENLIDYKLALGVDRFGYSHSDGDKSVSLWEVYFKPMIWSVTYRKFMFELSPYIGLMFAADGISGYDEYLFFDHPYAKLHTGSGSISYRITAGYEYRLGYQINKMFMVGITANYHTVPYGFHHNNLYSDSIDHSIIGGWGLNFQYNLPW